MKCTTRAAAKRMPLIGPADATDLDFAGQLGTHLDEEDGCIGQSCLCSVPRPSVIDLNQKEVNKLEK